MGSWTMDLANGVKDAVKRCMPVKVAVHSEAQAELGKRAAERLAPQFGADAELLTFVLIPDNEREQYPVGAILVP